MLTCPSRYIADCIWFDVPWPFCVSWTPADGTGADVDSWGAPLEQTNGGKADALSDKLLASVRPKGRTSKHRKLKVSPHGNIIVAAQALLLFVMAAGYFVASFMIERNEFAYQAELMPEHAFLSRRNTMINDLNYLTRQLALSPLLQNEFHPPGVAELGGKLVASQ